MPISDAGDVYNASMKILPIRTPLLQSGDDVATALCQAATFEDGDILVISSKAVATVEGAQIDLSRITITEEARMWAERCGKDAAFVQAMLTEMQRMHGTIASWCPEAILTQLKPDGFPEGVLLTAHAGLDQSNIPEGNAIGWPLDPVASVRALRTAIQELSGVTVAVILSDSCTRPRRLGVTAFALAVSGIDPFRSEIGATDLYGRTLRMTHEAIADQLATVANFLMGNSAQSTPAAIIRDHGLPFSPFEGWVPGIEPEQDLFRAML